ncbi:type II secretion system protein [bacterium]|nr:type II secretion system protein [bacterium]
MIKKDIIRRAFTLAEVLLVVAIIGIVATFAVPNLNKNINEEKYILLLRTTFDKFEVAYNAVLSQYGSMANAVNMDCVSGTTANNSTCLAAKIADKMDVTLNCGTSISKCFPGSSGYAFVLSNGVSIRFSSQAITSTTQVVVEFDLDGPNGPNEKGKDRFIIYLNHERNDNIEMRETDSVSEQVTPGSSFNATFDKTPWAYYVGNMDYLRCPNDLKWGTKETCD